MKPSKHDFFAILFLVLENQSIILSFMFIIHINIFIPLAICDNPMQNKPNTHGTYLAMK